MASSAKEKKYRRPRQKKVPAMAAEFDENGHQTVQSMMYGRIDPNYLTRLIMEYKAYMDPFVAEREAIAAIDKEKAAKMVPPEMGWHLGRCVDIIIKKTLGLPRWRDYSSGWHEEMYAHALLLVLRYLHRFDPAKVTSDPFFYAGMIVWNACNQVWNVLDRQNRRIKFIPLVDGIYHSVVAMDQYAGVLEKEEKKRVERAKAEVVNSGSITIDSAVDIIKELDEAAGIHIEEDWLAQLNINRAMKKIVNGKVITLKPLPALEAAYLANKAEEEKAVAAHEAKTEGPTAEKEEPEVKTEAP